MNEINFKPTNYHPGWQNARIQFLLSLYPPDFFKNKKILELAPFNGYIGNYFAEMLGADVTCIEGRSENCAAIKNDYPKLNVQCYNLDNPDWIFGKYDIIINFGLYYHLENFHRQHLLNCIDNCNLIFFESVIHDSYESTIYFRPEAGNDQSLSGIGGAPTTSYVENIFREKNCKFIKFSDKSLDIGHCYSWEDKNTNIPHSNNRRFWVVVPP